MKRFFLFSTILAIILGSNTISAQEDDDLPYLSDDDIASIEIVLPEDTPGNVVENAKEITSEEEKSTKANEMLRLNTSQSLYHLLILDRTYCSLNSDISDANSMEVLYKFKHGTNGYLIAIYKSSKEGPVFPQLPDKSRVIVDLITARKTTIKEYINSSAFRSFVTSRRITSQIQRILETNL
jgi:hypothetical protein